MVMNQALFLSLTIAPVSYIGVGLIKRWASRNQLVDIPNNRSSHHEPTPRGGGLMIVLATVMGFCLYLLLNQAVFQLNLLALLGGLGLVALIGWIDDLYSLSSKTRFFVHVLAGLLAIWGFGYWNQMALPGFGSISLGYWGIPLTLLWIVGLTNAYNFMDGIDGLAGSQAIIAGLSWYFVGLAVQVVWLEVLGLFVAAASLGFLGHNWSPARIFMGDVASGFLGYLFAVFPLIFHRVDSFHALPIGILVVWPFIFDTSFTFLGRLSRGENVFQAHRSHLYQRLVIAGYSHRWVTVFYIGLGCLGSGLAIGWYLGLVNLTLAFALLLCMGISIYILVKYREQEMKHLFSGD